MPLLRALPKGHQRAPPPPLALGPRVSSRRGMPEGHSRMRRQTRAENLTPSATSCWPAWEQGGVVEGVGGRKLTASRPASPPTHHQLS